MVEELKRKSSTGKKGKKGGASAQPVLDTETELKDVIQLQKREADTFTLSEISSLSTITAFITVG